MPKVELDALPFDEGRAMRINAARAVVPGDVVDAFVRGMFWTDPLVDAAVEDFANLEPGVGWRLLDEALASSSPRAAGAPVSLEALLEPVMSPPDWFDAEQVRWGAAVWWRFGVSVLIGMPAAQRLSYQWGDLNKPQAMNGRSEKMAARRYEETARWVLSATNPGTLSPGAQGFVDTIKIRFVHAMVRRKLRNDARWDTPAWGEPIHGTGMALTANAFLLAPIAVSRTLGASFTDAEMEAMRATWRWIAFLMGIPDQLLPTDLTRAQQMLDAGPMIFAPPDADSPKLDGALMRAGVRIERMFPRTLRPIIAPVGRPLASQALWGTSNVIMEQVWEHLDEPERVHHPLLTVLRPVIALSEHQRRRGRRGSDLAIADHQRKYLSKPLTLMKAAPRSVEPHQAVAPVA